MVTPPQGALDRSRFLTARGIPNVDVRVYTEGDSEKRPTKAITVRSGLITDLIEALQKAETEPKAAALRVIQNPRGHWHRTTTSRASLSSRIR